MALRVLREGFTRRGVELIKVYRHGPYKVEALYKHPGPNYDAIMSYVDRERAWTQDGLDAELHNGLLDALDRKLGA